MELFVGRIYAVVPRWAQGFTVTAGDNRIVDLGTEFGVEVDKSNNTQLHVTKGKTLLFSGDKDSKKPPVKVNAGAARQIDIAGVVRNIAVDREKFVQRINSQTGVIFNGQYVFVDKRPLAGRHDNFFLTSDPDSAKGVNVSIYDGPYNAKTDYDGLIPAATAIYMLGELPEVAFPVLVESGVVRPLYAGSAAFRKALKTQTHVARGYIELPESGKYIFNSGWNSYSYNVMELNGWQVYRKNTGDQEPVRQVVDIVAGKRYPIKITYFNGGGGGFWAYRVE
jgi:hypothetical protein